MKKEIKTGNSYLDNQLFIYPELIEYVENLYNYGLFHNPNCVNKYNKDNVPFLQSHYLRTLVFDAVKALIDTYGESANMHKNQSDGKLFSKSCILENKHIDLARLDCQQSMYDWTKQNIKNKPNSYSWYKNNYKEKVQILNSFNIEDLKNQNKNVEIQRRLVGSITEKLLPLQSYNKSLKTNIPAYNSDGYIVGNYDTLNKNGIYIDLKTKFKFNINKDLDLKISGNYFNTLHLINCFYNIEEDEYGNLRIKYLGYINIIKELYNKNYQIKDKVFTNEAGRETGRYTAFEFPQSTLIQEDPFNLTLTDIFSTN